MANTSRIEWPENVISARHSVTASRPVKTKFATPLRTRRSGIHRLSPTSQANQGPTANTKKTYIVIVRQPVARQAARPQATRLVNTSSVCSEYCQTGRWRTADFSSGDATVGSALRAPTSPAGLLPSLSSGSLFGMRQVTRSKRSILIIRGLELQPTSTAFACRAIGRVNVPCCAPSVRLFTRLPICSTISWKGQEHEV
jgi:hypothetical protein